MCGVYKHTCTVYVTLYIRLSRYFCSVYVFDMVVHVPFGRGPVGAVGTRERFLARVYQQVAHHFVFPREHLSANLTSPFQNVALNVGQVLLSHMVGHGCMVRQGHLASKTKTTC